MRIVCAALTVLLLTMFLALSGTTNYSRPSGARTLSNLCTFLTMAAPAYAETIHVYNGESIQDAIDKADKGDTVLVHPGAYVESILLKADVDVVSSDGPASTTILGVSDSTWTVHAPYLIPDFSFGGFTIQGDSTYGMYCYSPAGGHIFDLIFDCNADSAVLYDFHGSGSVKYEGITINGPASVARGLEAELSMAVFQEITVTGIEGKGICIWNDHGADLEDVAVDSCGIGLYASGVESHVEGLAISHCTTGLLADAHPCWSTHLTADTLTISDCTTGASVNADSGMTSIYAVLRLGSVTACMTGVVARADTSTTVILTVEERRVSHT